jgi:hypothetical protein
MASAGRATAAMESTMTKVVRPTETILIATRIQRSGRGMIRTALRRIEITTHRVADPEVKS